MKCSEDEKNQYHLINELTIIWKAGEGGGRNRLASNLVLSRFAENNHERSKFPLCMTDLRAGSILWFSLRSCSGQGPVAKVKFSLEQSTKAQRGRRCIALLFLQPRR